MEKYKEYWPLAVLAGLAFFSFQNQQPQQQKQPDGTTVVVPAPTNEAKAWKDLADFVRSVKDIPDTDYIVDVATRMKSQGKLSDLSRLNPFMNKNETVTDSNREEIAAIIGKE